MEKKRAEIKFTETEDGFRIEATGKNPKDMFSCCCIPVMASAKGARVVCCTPGEEDKSECCPPGEEKKWPD